MQTTDQVEFNEWASALPTRGQAGDNYPSRTDNRLTLLDSRTAPDYLVHYATIPPPDQKPKIAYINWVFRCRRGDCG